jgi:hypothetical protein
MWERRVVHLSILSKIQTRAVCNIPLTMKARCLPIRFKRSDALRTRTARTAFLAKGHDQKKVETVYAGTADRQS